MSAWAVRNVADALKQDGVMNADILSFANLTQTNASRDLDRITEQHVPLLQQVPLYKFRVPVEDPDDIGITDVQQSMMLPHELFSVMHTYYNTDFHTAMATDNLESFWDHIPTSRWHFDVENKKYCVPVRVFGDDVPVATTNSCNIVLWSSAAAFKQPASLSKLPVCCTPMKHAEQATPQAVYRVLAWSLECLRDGRWPCRDHLDKEWTDTTRKEMAGKRLAGPFSAIFFETGGDLKWIKETFALPWNYAKRDICWKCPASQRGHFSLKKCCASAPWLVHEMRRTQEEYAAAVSPLPPLARLLGFDITVSLLMDWMHNNNLGVEQIAAAEAILFLVRRGFFGESGGDAKVRMRVLLKRAWRRFCRYGKDHKLSHSQPMFKAATLTISKSDDKPCLKSKAHNCMMVMRWLNALLASLELKDSVGKHVTRVCWALAEADSICSDAPQWLGPKDVQHMKLAEAVLFQSWKALGWHCIPKHHMLQHQMQDATNPALGCRNPGGFWCHSEEHMMGVGKRSAGKNYQPQMGTRILFSMRVKLGICLISRAV